MRGNLGPRSKWPNVAEESVPADERQETGQSGEDDCPDLLEELSPRLEFGPYCEVCRHGGATSQSSY